MALHLNRLILEHVTGPTKLEHTINDSTDNDTQRPLRILTYSDNILRSFPEFLIVIQI